MPSCDNWKPNATRNCACTPPRSSRCSRSGRNSGERVEQYEQGTPAARARALARRACFLSYRSVPICASALEAYAQESEFIIEHTQLLNERGPAWAYLRYLGREHLHEQK